MASSRPGPITDVHLELQPWGDFLLTKRGSLIGALEIGGRDPDGLTGADFRALSLMARNIYQRLPEDLSITQYYSHFDNARVCLAPRDNPVCHLLSERRAEFLNGKRLTSSRIVHYFEIEPAEELSRLKPLSLLKHLALAIRDPNSRQVLGNHFSSSRSIMCFREELERQSMDLGNALEEVAGKWGALMEARILPLQEIWAHMRFLSNLDPDLLETGLKEQVPVDRWDGHLSDGDRVPVSVAGMDCLKVQGTTNKYARLLTVTRFGGQGTTPGMWAAGETSPVRQAHNYILMMRFRPLTKIQRALMFQGKKNELERQNLNFLDMLKGDDKKSPVEKQFSMKSSVARKIAELDEAETLEDRWGMSHGFVVMFDENPKKLRKTCTDFKRSMNQTGFSTCWEGVDVPDAWRTFLPAGRVHSIRDNAFTSSQFGAASLVFKSSEGQHRVKDLDEEAQYVFVSENHTPFYYSPFVGGRGVVFGVGPIRSGKSFTKNTVATHFMKYGGLFRAIDIDPGSEPVAYAFGEQGGVFRIEGGRTRGLNPFAAACGAEDTRFISHLKNQILQMIQTNDSEELRALDLHEQSQLDAAILATLKLPAEFQRLATVANHCPKSLQKKLARWVGGGMYGHLFDQPVDAIGDLNKPVAAFNLAGVKDDAVALPLVMSEIVYRVTMAFENPEQRLKPKWLDIDEGHALLKIPYMANYFVRSVRTWGKWRAGIGIWSQSPKEYLDLPDWPALRSAASTFFFMADPHLDQELYQAAFQLTPGECDAIRNLTPKREAYIIQPEIGVSKKIILEVEPEQYVVSTSTAHEADCFRRNNDLYGFEQAVGLTMEELGFKPRGLTAREAVNE